MSATAAAKNFVPIAKVGDVAEGAMKEIVIGEREVLLAMISGKYYAADNICPHMGGRLARGKLEGTVVTCPRHASQFDLTDGRVVRWTDWTGVKASVSRLFRAPRPIGVYPVKIEGTASSSSSD